MTYLIKNLLTELVNEQRLIRNFYCSYARLNTPKVSYLPKCPCIQIIISGSLKVIHRYRNTPIQKILTTNDAFFFRSNDNSSLVYSKPVTILSILFEKKQINCNLLNWDDESVSLSESLCTNSYDEQINEHLLQALNSLANHYQGHSHGIKTLRFLILSLLNHILFSLSEPVSFNTSKNLRTALIRQYIDLYFQNSPTRQKLAILFHISPNYLSFIFHQEQGIGLNEYLLQTKLRHAQKLLLYNQLTIKDIAIASGFQDDSYFRRIFRKKIGCTATEYKDQYSHNTTII